MNIVFAGTPDFAALALTALLKTEHTVTAVLTQPDRPSGRGRKPQASPVKQVALAANIPVLQPLKLTAEDQAIVFDHPCDLMIVAAYGLIVPQRVLDWPKFGCINIHASLLPRWRGAAPIQRAILAGDEETGITLMQMDAGLDTGAMLAKSTTPITQTDTAASLHDRLAQMGADLLCDTLTAIEAGTLNPEAQDNSLANYAHKLQKREGRLDWSQSADALARQIRGLTPWPGCYTFLNDKRVKIVSATAQDADTTHDTPGKIVQTDDQQLLVLTGQGRLKIDALQLQGSRAMQADAFLNGNQQLLETHPCFSTTEPTENKTND